MNYYWGVQRFMQHYFRDLKKIKINPKVFTRYFGLFVGVYYID